jgi:hypothetical protein
MFRKQPPRINLLELIPQRRCEFNVDADRIVTVKLPRFRREWMIQFLVPRWKSPFIQTKLDRVGSFVWLQCDGDQSVHDIAERMREEFGEDIEPVYDRLKLFLHQLGKRDYLSLVHPDGTPFNP